MKNFKDIQGLNEVLSTKPKKKKHTKQFNGKVDLRRLLKSKTIKKTDKEVYITMLASVFSQFEKELKIFFKDGKSKAIEDKVELTELLTNKRFAKALCAVMKEREEASNVVYFAISELWLNNQKALTENTKLMKMYFKLFAEFNKKEIKSIAGDLGIKKDEALQFALASVSYKEARMKSMRLRFKGFLNQLYLVDDLTEKKAAKVIKKCFKNKQIQLISYALTERPRKDDENFSIVTNAILSMLEKMEKDTRKDLLKRYGNNRAKNPKAGRRLNLFAINEEDYKNIYKTVEKLINAGMSKEVFL